MTFLHPSTLCKFRKHLGEKGVAIIEEAVFNHLKDARAIEADMMLQDSTVLESPIIYPTDVRLLYTDRPVLSGDVLGREADRLGILSLP